MLTIDGAAGEGGGQILRTSLSLSLATRRPVRIRNIRANRSKPGLLRQHLAAVRAIEALGAQVSGAELGASEVTVQPGQVAAGEHRFAVGSAGSACLVLQTVLPPLLLAQGPSRLSLEGGTHNPFAPPFDFIDRVFLPVINRMGPCVRARLDRVGFYPVGGGEMIVEIDPTTKLEGLQLSTRGVVERVRSTALFSSLPVRIAQRELEVVRRRLALGDSDLLIQEDKTSRGPGNALIVEAEYEGGREISVGFAERGVKAEKVAGRAVSEMERFLAADVPVGTRLADQLMVPFALAGSAQFRTLPLTQHSRTNLEIIGRFLDTPIDVVESEGTTAVVFGESTFSASR